MRRKPYGTWPEYKALLDEADALMSQPDWYERWPELVRRMDAVWGRGPHWAPLAREYMQQLYDSRLNK